jgi:hypothetical protein
MYDYEQLRNSYALNAAHDKRASKEKSFANSCIHCKMKKDETETLKIT